MSLQDDMAELKDALAELKKTVITEARANWPMLLFTYLTVVAIGVVINVMFT